MPCWSRPERPACPWWIHTIQVSRQSCVHGCTHANRGRDLLWPRPLRARSRPLASTAEVSAMAATTHSAVPLQTKLPLLPRDLPLHLLLSCKWGGRAAHVRKIGSKCEKVGCMIMIKCDLAYQRPDWLTLVAKREETKNRICPLPE